MRRAVFPLLVFAAGCGAPPPVPLGGSPDVERIQGVWKIAGVDTGAAATQPTWGAAGPVRFVFRGNTLTVFDGGPPKSFAVALETEHDTKRLTRTTADEQGRPRGRVKFARGTELVRDAPDRFEDVYRFDDDALVLTWTLRPNGPRPTDFTPKPFAVTAKGTGRDALKGTGDPGAFVVYRLVKTAGPPPAWTPPGKASKR